MKIDRKLDDSYRVLIPVEIRNKLDIEKYEPLTLDFNEETKEITITFNKYKKEKVIVKASISPIERLPNPVTIEPLESTFTKLQIRKRNLVTIPNPVFKELNLSKKKYNVMYAAGLKDSTLTLSLAKDGIYNYRKENILSFSEINTYFNLDIHEGIFCNFKYKSDGTLIFTFNSIDIKIKEPKYKEISLEERLYELDSKFKDDGLCKEEFKERDKIREQLESESEKDLLEELGPDIQHELKEYRKQLPKFKKTDTIELKNIGDSIIVKSCPRCGNTIIGDNTLKINGQLHCEECSKDFKNQLIEELKRKHKR